MPFPLTINDPALVGGLSGAGYTGPVQFNLIIGGLENQIFTMNGAANGYAWRHLYSNTLLIDFDAENIVVEPPSAQTFIPGVVKTVTNVPDPKVYRVEEVDALLAGFTHIQSVPVSQITLAHGLGRRPSAVALYVGDELTFGDVFANSTDITVQLGGSYAFELRAR